MKIVFDGFSLWNLAFQIFFKNEIVKKKINETYALLHILHIYFGRIPLCDFICVFKLLAARNDRWHSSQEYLFVCSTLCRLSIIRDVIVLSQTSHLKIFGFLCHSIWSLIKFIRGNFSGNENKIYFNSFIWIVCRAVTIFTQAKELKIHTNKTELKSNPCGKKWLTIFWHFYWLVTN